MEDGTGVIFDNVAENFTGNFDESCFMDNQYGSIKIVASVFNNKPIRTVVIDMPLLQDREE